MLETQIEEFGKSSAPSLEKTRTLTPVSGHITDSKTDFVNNIVLFDVMFNIFKQSYFYKRSLQQILAKICFL